MKFLVVTPPSIYHFLSDEIVDYIKKDHDLYLGYHNIEVKSNLSFCCTTVGWGRVDYLGKVC